MSRLKVARPSPRAARRAARAEAAPPVRWPDSLQGRDLLSLRDLNRLEVGALLDWGAWLKAHPGLYRDALVGKTVALLFEKPSLRTRATFEIAVNQLGARALYLGPQEVGLGKRESVKDVALNLARWVDAVVARVFSHQSLTELAEHAVTPVINGLSDFEHPCQALGDYLTLLEHKGRLDDVTLAWVGDGNNVAHSLLYGAAKLGVRLQVATPPGYEPKPAVIAGAKRDGAEIKLTHDPVEGVTGADAVYTDVWTSMGQEGEAGTRQQIFRPFQVNRELMRRARPGAFFMHCLPAHRGEEVTNDVIDAPNSIVYDQAENRLHIQKAVLLAVLE